MTHYITADHLVESAIKAVTEELFRDFDNTLRSLCDEDDDRKAVFRTLRYARIRLHVLCGYISKEEMPENRTQIRFLYIVTNNLLPFCFAPSFRQIHKSFLSFYKIIHIRPMFFRLSIPCSGSAFVGCRRTPRCHNPWQS